MAKSTKTATADTSATLTESNGGVQYKVRTELDPHAVIPVRNGFQGRLIYKSKHTQEVYEWDSFGDEQDMEFQELKNAKNSAKAFFANNWFLFDDPAVIDALGVEQYYKHALSCEEFDEMFSKSPDEIKAIIEELSDGQKLSIAYRARQLITENKIDSIKVITALEDGLGITLLDRGD